MNQHPPSLHLRALATDFDGTLAHNGTVSEATLRAGHKLVLVTGRELNDLAAIFLELDWFDLAVMENGAVLFHPSTQTTERWPTHCPKAANAVTIKTPFEAHCGSGRVPTCWPSRWSRRGASR